MSEEMKEEEQENNSNAQKDHEHDSKGTLNLSSVFLESDSSKAEIKKQMTKVKTKTTTAAGRRSVPEELSEKKISKDQLKNARLILEEGYDDRGRKVNDPMVVPSY